MKKKLIENMPAPRITKDMEGMVVIARNPEKGLLTLDVVETLTKNVQVRICITKNEFMNYYPEEGIWDNKHIENIITRISQGNILDYNLYGKSNIKKALGINNSLHSVELYEHEITREKRWAEEERRKKRCQERNAKVPELDKKMDEWLKRYVGGIHYIYYKRNGNNVQVACSACGKEGRYIMIPVTYEDHLKKNLGFKPEHNMGGEPCPMCGTYGKWKAAGKTKGVYGQWDHRYVVDKVEDTIVIRYFEIKKIISGTEFEAWEKTDCVEVARNWFLKEKIQKDYNKYNPYTSKNFWDDVNLSGLANIQQRSGKVYLKKNVLKGTPFQYSGLEQEVLQNDYTNAERYLTTYLKFPGIEMLGKLGMTRIKNAILDNWGECKWLNQKGKKPWDIFKITRQRFNDLKEKNGDIVLLSIYQYECKNNIRFKEKLVEILYFFEADKNKISVIRRHAKLERAMHYLLKQAGIEKLENRSCMLNGARQEIQRYVDYLNMLEQNGRQFTEHEVYPVNLVSAHNREVILLNQKKAEKEIIEKNKKNPNIKKDAAKYNRKYRYQNEDYIIRAPKDAAEILMEGLRLNHCVGRMGYIEAMNRHETVILFLRQKKHRDVPYYTLEIKNGKLAQAYGYGDGKPEWEKVSPFLEAFQEAKLDITKSERKAG